jgi:hypothetical protein
MSRKIPNINVSTSLTKRDRLSFKEFVLKVNTDTFTYSYIPNEIYLDESNTLFTLILRNKRFIIDILTIDTVKDYIDVYLFGVKQPQDRYNVEATDNDIIVTFIVDITRVPTDVKLTDFEIKGKIAEIE